MFCRTCQSDKPAEGFYASNKARCKECVCASVKAHRAANLEQVRQYDRMRASQPHRAAARSAYAETDAGKAAAQRAKARFAAKRRGYRPLRSERPKVPVVTMAQRRVARVVLNNALRDRKVQAWPVCAVPECAKTPEAHHADYSAPLAVTWLCRSHHRQAHALVANESDMKEQA